MEPGGSKMLQVTLGRVVANYCSDSAESAESGGNSGGLPEHYARRVRIREPRVRRIPTVDITEDGSCEITDGRVYDSVLGLLCDVENPTPLVRLDRVVPFEHARVYAKLEWYNPSARSRIASPPA